MTKDRVKNLIVVAAVDYYADRHRLSRVDALDLFLRWNLPQILRDHYDVLHTHDLFEGGRFAEDYLKRCE